MNLTTITPLILTYNEEANLARCLARLSWAREILIIDSFSTDATVAIARSHPQVLVKQRSFDSFASQCNFGLKHVRSEWVLSLDADYVLETEFTRELIGMTPDSSLCGFGACFSYCVMGHPLRASLYPPRTVLYRRTTARYEDDGHAHRVRIAGSVGMLQSRILHDDRKPLSRWLSSQDRYASLEAEKLIRTARVRLGFNDRIRRTILLGPPAVLLYTLFVRGVVLDGWAGWHYAFQRALAETLLSLRLIEAKWSAASASVNSSPAAD